MRLALAGSLVLALAGCAVTATGTTPGQLWRSIAPGIAIRCAGHCIVYPIDADNAPAPGERPNPTPF